MELKINSTKQFRQLPYAVVDLAISEGWTKELCYFLHFTSIYGNSIIYNYSSRSLSEKTGISKSAIHKNISFLLKKGLFIINYSGHLVSLSKSGLRDWYINYSGKSTGKGYVTIKLHKYIKHTEYNLFARVAINNVKRQKFLSKKRAEVNAIRAKVSNNSFVLLSEYKKYNSFKEAFEKKQTENAYNPSFDTCFLSDSYLCSATGKSVGTVRSMVKFWEQEGILNFGFLKGQVLDTHVSRVSYSALVDVRPEFVNTYYYKGRIIQYNRRAIRLGINIKER